MKKAHVLFICLFVFNINHCRHAYSSKDNHCVVIVSTGFDDDGKGKIALKLTKTANAIVRGQEASYNVHTASRGNDSIECYMLPPSIIRRNIECFLAQGVDIDVKQLLTEIETLEQKGFNLKGRLWISSKAHVIMPYHKQLGELDNKKGRRKSHDFSRSRRGISWCSADKRLRGGIRIADIMNDKIRDQRIKEAAEYVNLVITGVYDGLSCDIAKLQKEFTGYANRLKPYVLDNLEVHLNKMLAAGKSIVVEATGGTFSDVGLGTVPYVSPSSTTASGALTGAGIGPRVGLVIGVTKAYGTRSGKGPLPTEITDAAIINCIKKCTKRSNDTAPKISFSIPFAQASNALQTQSELVQDGESNMRYGWLDLVLVRQAILINGIDSLAISMLDGLDELDEILVCYDYVLDGKSIDYLPTLEADALRVRPRYMKFKGWKCSTRNTKSFSDLPEEARYYLKKIEALCNNTSIDYVSVGPDNSQTIVINPPLIL